MSNEKRFINPKEIVGGIERKMAKVANGWPGNDGKGREDMGGLLAQTFEAGAEIIALRNSPQVLKAYLGQMCELGTHSMENLARLAVTAASNTNTRVVLNIGFGGTVDPVLARCPAYIINAIRILEELSGLNLPAPLPIVKVFSTQSLASLNDYNLEEVNPITDQMFSLLRAYVEQFHPALIPNFRFEKPQVDQSKVMQYVTLLEESDDDSVKDALVAIGTMGQAHGGSSGRDNAIIYAAAHPLFFQDTEVKGGEQPHFVVSLGGHPEIQFNVIRHAIKELLYATNPDDAHFPCSVMGIVPAGEKPVYYADPRGDVTVMDFIRNPNKRINTRADGDLKLLLSDVGSVTTGQDGRQSYCDFLKQWVALSY